MADIIQIPTTDHSLILNEIKQSYHREAGQFLKLAEKQGGITIDVMKQVVTSLNDEHKSGRTINKYISAMKTVVREAYSIEKLSPAEQHYFEKKMKDEVPTVTLAESEKEITEDDILTEAEYNTLQEHASDRLSLIMEFLWSTACRISEVMGANYSNCEVVGDTVKVKIIGKNNKQRTVRISLDLYNRIKHQFRGTVYLFESSRTTGNKLDDRNIAKQIRTLGKKYLNRTIGPHMFRHSWATRMIKEKKDIKKVSKYLGHASTSITMDMYVHTSMTDEDLGIV